MHALPAVVTGHWKTGTVSINGKIITPARFVRDLKEDEQEPGDNRDILQECRSVSRFCWGDASQATYCLSLACCFYLNVSWVMDRFFTGELQRAPQADIHLTYTTEGLQAAYDECEEQFAQEFADFMKNLGAVPEEEV
jgi:hypothetical protein